MVIWNSEAVIWPWSMMILVQHSKCFQSTPTVPVLASPPKAPTYKTNHQYNISPLTKDLHEDIRFPLRHLSHQPKLILRNHQRLLNMPLIQLFLRLLNIPVHGLYDLQLLKRESFGSLTIDGRLGDG